MQPLIPIQKLSDADFKQTLEEPPQLEVYQQPISWEVELYMESILRSEALFTSLEQITPHCIYTHPHIVYQHLIFSYTQADKFIVLVTNPGDQSIIGYHLLDLSEQTVSNFDLY
jgi:hypothetical protein